MPLQLVAINPRPKAVIANIEQRLDEILGAGAGFAGSSLRDLATYPPARPWKRRPPRKGPRAGGRRTGTLGRNWKLRVAKPRDQWTWSTLNGTRYAVYVEGPNPGEIRRRQTPAMAARDWPSITSVAEKNWRTARPLVIRVLTQRDPRLTYPRL